MKEEDGILRTNRNKKKQKERQEINKKCHNVKKKKGHLFRSI